MSDEPDTLLRLESYYDAVPRARATVEQVGPFTLFVATSGWPFYARPRRGSTSDEFGVHDVEAVFARQRELDVPLAMEWVDDVTPGLAAIVEATGGTVQRCPLLVLAAEPQGDTGTARMLDASTPEQRRELLLVRAAIGVGFDNPGTSIGSAGTAERDADVPDEGLSESLVERLTTGELRQAGVYAAVDAVAGPVGGGTYSPVDGVAEITGVAVLPAYRRRGLAAHVVQTLTTDALAHTVRTVFCSAQSSDVARVYERVGFVRVGTACIASATH